MAGPYGEPISAKIFDLISNARDYAEGCNKGLGCAVATNSVYFKNQAGEIANIPQLDLSALCDSSLGSYIVTLPPLSGFDHNVEIVKTSGDDNVVTIMCSPGDTFVDGSTSFLLYDQNDFLDLLANSSLGAWAVRGYRQHSPPLGKSVAALVFSTASQNIAKSVQTPVRFNSTLYDDLGMFDGSTKLVAPQPGIYTAHGAVHCLTTETNNNTMNAVSVRVNGTTYYGAQTVPAVGDSINISLGISQLLQLVEGDYVELMFYQSVLTTVAIGSGPQAQTNFSLVLIVP